MGLRITPILRDSAEESTVEVGGFELLPLTKRRASKMGIPLFERGYHPALWGVCNRIFGRVPDWWHTCDLKDEWGEYQIWRDKGWDGVEVRLHKRPVAARIVSVSSEPKGLASRSRRNTSKDKRGTFTIELQHGVSLEHTRTTSDEWSVGSETSVELEVGGELAQSKVTVSQTLSFGYTHGVQRSRTRGETIDVSDSIEVELGPGEEAIASLQATQGHVEVDVDFEISLHGMAMFSFHQKLLNGGRDHAVDIERVMKLLGRPNIVRTTERMSLGFISDGTAVLADA